MSGGLRINAGRFHSVVVRIGPPSARAKDGKQHQQENDSAGADARVLWFKEGIESGERFIRRSAIGGIISMSIREGLV